MKIKKLASLVLAASLTLASGCGAGLPFDGGGADTLPEECASLNDFSAVLTRVLDDREDNLALSPLSAYIALAMAAEGSAGETKAQFEKVLGASTDDIASAVGRIDKRLMDLKGSTKLAVAQSVWTDDRVEFSEDYISHLADLYKADIYSGKLSSTDVRNAINRWAADNTNGLIDPFLSSNLDDNTVMALLNTIYFKGTWQRRFDPEATRGSFENAGGGTGTVDYMHLSASLKYIDTDEVTGVVLPYDDGKTQMIVVMPKDSAELPSAAVCRMGSGGLAKAAADAGEKRIRLSLPSFTVECSLEMNKALNTMGLTDAFTDGADFSGMGDGGFAISQVLQKVKLIVDTEGTEAAAVTAVIMKETAMMPEDQLELTFDRPFYYAVMDTETSIPLFTGVYNTAQ